MNTARKIVASMVLAVLALTGCASHKSAAAKPPTTLAGSWVDADGDKDLDFNALIENDQINIIVHLGDTQGLYWVGSVPQTDKDFLSVPTEANKKAMDESMYASQALQKEFTFDGHHITFEFSILGVTRTITLNKN